jgi:DNA polymerase-4
MSKQRYIAHVDMDAFFAAIEQRDNPSLAGKPVIVGADPRGGKGRGVVSTCSYEARVYGVRSAMPISFAYRKCPHAVFLPVNMDAYSAVSDRIYDIFYDFTPEIEPVSIDEAFLDISGTCHLFGTPEKTCELLKSRIRTETNLSASIGLAPTKMAAKIASDLKKPDGFVVVTQEGLLEFLRPLDVSRLWGLGKKTEAVLRGMGVQTIGDLAGADAGELRGLFGKNGAHFWSLARGIDERSVETVSEAKSISNEITFERDTGARETIEGALMRLSEKVSDRLRRNALKGRTVTLKIRLEGFKTYTRGSTLAYATNFTDVLYKETRDLYNAFDRKGKRVRLVGVKVSNLCAGGGGGSLFRDTGDRKREDVHKAVEDIKRRFGDASIHRATSDLSKTGRT